MPIGTLLHTEDIAVTLADGIGSSTVSQVASAAAVRGFPDDDCCTSKTWSVRRSAQCVLRASNSWLHAQTLHGDGRFDKDRGQVWTFSTLVFTGCEVYLLATVGADEHLDAAAIQRASWCNKRWHAAAATT